MWSYVTLSPQVFWPQMKNRPEIWQEDPNEVSYHGEMERHCGCLFWAEIVLFKSRDKTKAEKKEWWELMG